ncbi:hypothetical protein [Aureimonas endophytica]|uniref:hypothetical protein n=1 Tax=Aureimonas endophytica TaxID=2027858 RepID=UPI00166EB615|nr:hypothetical protein [Aureimonas endophytica]
MVGNQQKVILARWIALKPTLLNVEEPTRWVPACGHTGRRVPETHADRLCARKTLQHTKGRLYDDAVADFVSKAPLFDWANRPKTLTR